MARNMCRFILLFFVSFAFAQHRAPPGVNPQQYHHAQAQPNSGQFQPPPPPPQQYQHGAPGVPPPQYQQQPTQQQFQQPVVPQQQQYQPPAPQQQQYQQPNQQAAHNQHAAHNQQQQRVLHNPNMNNERDHIKDHLEVPLDTSGMSEEEIQYHYFKMHDADSNNKLDGQELIKSLFHWHDSSNHDPAATTHSPPGPKIFTDEELVNMIDPILDQDDKNRDGFIDYPEFVQAQRAAAAAAAAAPKNTV